MNDVTNVASPTDTQVAKPELKSTDTGTFQSLKEDAAKVTAPPQQQAKPAEKLVSDVPVTVNGEDADPAADHPEEKLLPWMKKRLERAQEKGRKQAIAEFSSLIAQPQVQAPPAAPVAEQPANPQRKSLADFDNDIEAYTDYLADEKVENAFKKREEKAANEAKEAKAQEARQVFEKRAKEFETKTGVTWDDVISVEVDIPQEVVDLIKDHPRDLFLGHYLVTNPTELESLRGKSRLEIATRLAEIDRTLNGTQATATPSKRELPPKTTKAPPPPAELPSGSNPVKSIENMTTEERIAEWRKQKAARRQ